MTDIIIGQAHICNEFPLTVNKCLHLFDPKMTIFQRYFVDKSLTVWKLFEQQTDSIISVLWVLYVPLELFLDCYVTLDNFGRSDSLFDEREKLLKLVSLRVLYLGYETFKDWTHFISD